MSRKQSTFINSSPIPRLPAHVSPGSINQLQQLLAIRRVDLSPCLGAIVRFPAHEADSIAELLYPGAPLAVRGEVLMTELGTVIEAKEIGASADATRSINSKKPKHDKPPKHSAKHNGRVHG